jgi:hypothetical protein
LRPLAGRKYASLNAQPDFRGQPPEEALFDLAPVVLLEPLPGPGLGREHEVENVARDQAQGAVVLLRLPPVVAPGRAFPVPRFLLPGHPRPAGKLGGLAPQQGVLDGFLETPLGDEAH